MSNTFGYKIFGYDLSLYCKITEYGINMDKYMCSMSFGRGMNMFCLTAIYKAEKPYEIYIDSVEKNDLCVIDGTLSEFEDGLVKLVRIALSFMKKVYPHVLKFTLQDDSQIYCTKGSKKDKLSLAYDYILKYNETWYENKFNAELPGYIGTESNIKIAKPNTYMDDYLKSLKELDKSLIPFDMLAQKISAITKYNDEYSAASTPREFIKNIRAKYKDKYCYEVGKWLNIYMLYLQIKLSPEHWLILTTNVPEVPNFKANKLSHESLLNIKFGGNRRRKTRKQYPFSVKRGLFTESYIEDWI